MIPISPQIQIPEEELQWSYARSGGPGGQNVNKVSSKAHLRWNVRATTQLPEDVRQRFLTRYATRITEEGELVLSSDRYRDQPRNRQDCIDKLVSMVRDALFPPKPRRPTKPTKGSKVRRLNEKKHNAATKASRRRPKADE